MARWGFGWTVALIIPPSGGFFNTEHFLFNKLKGKLIHMTTPLTIEEFGSELLRTLDLDPVYVMLTHPQAGLSSDRLAKWLLAYWCFYHSGVASYLSDALTNNDFWEGMHTAAANNVATQNWPRAAERRHFRGSAAVNAMVDLNTCFLNPELMIWNLERRTTFKEMNAYVQTWTQFGPWIAFKVCDMAQAVLRLPLDMTGATLSVYREPAEGARLAYQHWHPGDTTALSFAAPYYVAYAAKRLLAEFALHKAPPHMDRELNLFEVETILCKWKSHMKGHYPVGKDTREIIHGLEGWGETAQKLRKILIAQTEGEQ